MIELVKWGGSRLKQINDLENIVNNIKKEIEDNKKVICVLSAFNGYTDVLIDKYLLDKYVVLGELISVSLLNINLQINKIKSIILTAKDIPILCNDIVSDSNIVDLDIDKILDCLKEYDVVLIPGFQGIYNNEYYTLGRDGSDYTAIYIGKKLKEKGINFECHLYKDVDGIYINGIKQDVLLIESLYDFKYKVLARKAIDILQNTPFDLTIGLSKDKSTKIINFIS